MVTPRHPPDLQIEPLRVLITDDNFIVRQMAAAWLQARGIETVLAANGAQAVQLIADAHEFDLVLMDLQMPVMDGVAATARIRELEKAKDAGAARRLTILAYTTEDVGPGDSFLKLGFDGVLSKPFVESELGSHLVKWCPEKMRARLRAQAS